MVKMNKEKGFTLLEAVIGVGIMALVVGALATTTTTLLLNHGRAAEQNVALPQVQNAGYWITRDVQTARNVTATAPNGFPLSIKVPVDMDPDNDNTVIYSFAGHKLMRTLYDSTPTLISQSLIADYIDTGNTIFSVLDPDTGLYKLAVTAVRDRGGVTMSYEVGQRLSPGES